MPMQTADLRPWRHAGSPFAVAGAGKPADDHVHQAVAAREKIPVPVPAKMRTRHVQGAAFGNRCYLLSNRRAGALSGSARTARVLDYLQLPSYRRALVIGGNLPARTMGESGVRRPPRRNQEPVARPSRSLPNKTDCLDGMLDRHGLCRLLS